MQNEITPGAVLAGKFRVERVIGQGGMGVVVEATHLQLEQRVALKFLLPNARSLPETLTRFTREARAAAKIRSEHVARVIDVGTLENGAPYIVMEYLEGLDLSRRVIEQGLPTLPDALLFVLQACEALAEAHVAGIVHRDLKPSNLFLTRFPDGTPCVKILDFGISKLVPPGSNPNFSMTSTATVMGSPHYMSPEQMRSTRDVDARTDIWALGVILYELVSGRVPFDAETMPQLCGMVLSEPPLPLNQLRADVPARLEQVILRCLEKDPSRRYQSVAELTQALAEFAPAEAQRSVERIARLAGTTAPGTGRHRPADSSPPASMPETVPASVPAPIPPPSASPSRVTFGATAANKPRGRGPGLLALLAALVAVGGAGAWFWYSQARPSTSSSFAATPLDTPPEKPRALQPSVPSVATPTPASSSASTAATPTAGVSVLAAPTSTPGSAVPAVSPEVPPANGKAEKKKKKASTARTRNARPASGSESSAPGSQPDPLNGRL